MTGLAFGAVGGVIIRIGTELERDVARLEATLPAEMTSDPEEPRQTL
jgi:hypothetical protein